jgi:O-antigen/teichoic acid export membrane protein
MSLFVVVPYLSSDQTTYGIYSVCVSITVFLSYADLGFLGAGMKYAAESFSRGDRKSEIELVGFSHFILLIFVLILSLGFFLLSLRPDLLIKGIQPGEQIRIAHSLLLILAVFSPTIIVQRALQMIYGVRLHDYMLQRINIFGSIVKITSVLYFFRHGHYEIVEYFLFIQLISVIVAFLGILQAKRKFDYDFNYLISQVRFSPEIFNKTKALAFSSLFVTVSWILYYELDSFAIGKILGAKQVAIFAIGFTILTFFRSLLGVFFSPFSARFNHFVGAEKHDELKKFYLHLMTISFPVVVFPIAAVVLFARPLVISWVGSEYENSIIIAQMLVLCNVMAFISYPAGMLLVAKEQLKEIYIVSILMPLLYWGGIVLTVNAFGVESFAFFKFIAFLVSGVIYLIISLKFLDITIMNYIRHYILPYASALIVMCIALYFLKNSFVNGKNSIYLLINAMIVFVSVLLAFVVSLLMVSPLRIYFKKILITLQKKE